MLTGQQIREARKLLQWDRATFSRNASLSRNTTSAIESTDGVAWLSQDQEGAIRRACEDAGVIFIETNCDGPRVRLRKGAP